jgi:hypothetical protein
MLWVSNTPMFIAQNAKRKRRNTPGINARQSFITDNLRQLITLFCHFVPLICGAFPALFSPLFIIPLISNNF